MKVIKTELSVRKVNARMKKKGFTPRKSRFSSLVMIYVKKDTRIMYAFERKIQKYRLSYGGMA